MQSVGFEIGITGSCSAVKYCTKTTFPQSRAHHAACQHENWIYILAGKDGNITLKDFWRFSIGNQTWEKLNYRGELPPHLQGHTLVSFKKLLLLFGGEFGDAVTESSLWIINPDLGYVRKACLDVGSECPCIRRYHSAVIYRDCMYVYGGYVDVKGSSSEFWKYDVEDEEWELLPPQQRSNDRPGRRYGHSAVVYKQCMWVYGGMNNLVPKQDLWCYSFVSERWERIKCKVGPPPLTGHSAAVIGAQMVIYGGETNREPVSQVWSFNFLTQKWTQVIFMGPNLPSKSLHTCVMVNPAALIEVTFKARSTPYLQNKTKDHIKRPKSSPGYRISSEPCNQDSQNVLIFERTNSVIEIEKHEKERNVDSCSICKNRMTKPYRRSVSNVEDILYLHPSPSENSKDILPLVPSKTDINYNDVYMLDKDTVGSGLDNPGISDSTEKLIEENKVMKGLNQERMVMNYLQQSDKCSYFESNSKRKICSECAKNNSIVKKHRLDPDLILEDLEYEDCFPYNIQVPLPVSNLISLQRTNRDTDGVETIELQDFVYNGTLDCSENDIKQSKCVTSPVFNSGSIDSDIHHDSDTQQPVVGTAHSDGFTVKLGVECDKTSQELETSFQLSENHPMYPQKKPALHKQNPQERPYILIVGGKDKQSVNFTIKPLSLMKLQLSST